MASKVDWNKLSGPSGFMGYGDLWGFILHGLFILNPCLDLWGFMGIYITCGLSINPHKSKDGFSINEFCKINPHNPQCPELCFQLPDWPCVKKRGLLQKHYILLLVLVSFAYVWYFNILQHSKWKQYLRTLDMYGACCTKSGTFALARLL